MKAFVSRFGLWDSISQLYQKVPVSPGALGSTWGTGPWLAAPVCLSTFHVFSKSSFAWNWEEAYFNCLFQWAYTFETDSFHSFHELNLEDKTKQNKHKPTLLAYRVEGREYDFICGHDEAIEIFFSQIILT